MTSAALSADSAAMSNARPGTTASQAAEASLKPLGARRSMNLMQVWSADWPLLSAITARRPPSSSAKTILRWAHMSSNFAHWSARRKIGVQVTIGCPARALTSHSARPAISRIRPSSRWS
jgi:hypothetical protein